MRVAHQQALFADFELDRVVNVASVPQRSPFRYPGGKTWLIPQIRRWLWGKQTKPTALFEPFAGGGIVSLTVAAEHLASHATMIELDEEIAAVWQTILGNGGKWLADAIVEFNLTRESLYKELSRRPTSNRQKAFQTILKNRTFHGGILAPGSGALKNGENGKGVRSRWYPETLQRRILAIIEIRNRLTFVWGDGVGIIERNAHRKDVVFFVDPPYTAGGKNAGNRLYKYFELDHENLFRAMSKASGDFLMTYDNSSFVRELAKQFNFDTQLVAMKGTHHREMNELLIGPDLDWARGLQSKNRSSKTVTFPTSPK
jgi:DNA adenine methylase